MTNKSDNKSEDNIENRIFDNLKADDQDKNQPGLLPPQALLSTPPPSLDSTEDTSTLLSPWWSEEPPAEQLDENTTDNVTLNYEIASSNEAPEESTTPSATTTTPIEKEIETTTETMDDNKKKDNVLNISLLTFGRSGNKDNENQWKERCFLLTLATEDVTKATDNVEKDIEHVFSKSKKCNMICFLKTSRDIVKQQEEEEEKSIFHQFNPFYGTFISVAKTPQRCKEHLLTPGYNPKQSAKDYYTFELGDELSHSGEYVTRAVSRTYSPLQTLAQKYMDSWKDGRQQAFFSKFWNSIQKGDAFYLVRDISRKLIDNAIGHDKKPSDKK